MQNKVFQYQIKKHKIKLKKKRIAKLEAEEYGVPIVDEEVQHKIEISHNKWKDTHESHNKWKDSHEENAKVIKADTSKWDNDWDKINKQREEIKAMKEKKRISKLYAEQGISISDQETQDKIEESRAIKDKKRIAKL
eukprot:467240_1